MFGKIFRFIISAAIIPLCVAVTISFYTGLLKVEHISESGFNFILGAFSYCILHIVLFKLDFLYVLGHEVMHTVAALFSGGKVLGIKVSSKEGSVKTTKSGFFVTTAPYLVPIYTLLTAILYFGLSFFMDISKYSEAVMFIIGFTLMFHLAYTADSIKGKQSDLIKAGYLLSISLIYIVNLIIVFGIISFLFKDASFLDFIAQSYERSKLFYYLFWRQMFL